MAWILHRLPSSIPFDKYQTWQGLTSCLNKIILLPSPKHVAIDNREGLLSWFRYRAGEGCFASLPKT